MSVDGELIIQSTALIEFIEDTFDGPSLLLDDLIARARSRAFAQVIACEMHPINEGRVKTHLVNEHAQSDADWSR